MSGATSSKSWTLHPSEALLRAAERTAKRSRSTGRRRMVLIIGLVMLAIAIIAIVGAPLFVGVSPIKMWNIWAARTCK